MGKVVSTTTDNGRNYVSAFQDFGTQEVPLYDVEEEDPEVVVANPRSVEDLLAGEEITVELPPHHRCW